MQNRKTIIAADRESFDSGFESKNTPQKEKKSMKTRFAIVTALVFALALLLGAMTGLAQDENSGQTDQGIENTPGGGASNTPGSYERHVGGVIHQARGAVRVLTAEDTGGGMENTPGGGTSNTPKPYERRQLRSAAQLFAQANMGGGMSNAPGTGTLPTLSGNKTGEFTATVKSDAQKVCDEVAMQNGKSSCTAEAGAGTNMWYCECK